MTLDLTNQPWDREQWIAETLNARVPLGTIEDLATRGRAALMAEVKESDFSPDNDVMIAAILAVRGDEGDADNDLRRVLRDRIKFHELQQIDEFARALTSENAWQLKDLERHFHSAIDSREVTQAVRRVGSTAKRLSTFSRGWDDCAQHVLEAACVIAATRPACRVQERQRQQERLQAVGYSSTELAEARRRVKQALPWLENEESCFMASLVREYREGAKVTRSPVLALPRGDRAVVERDRPNHSESSGGVNWTWIIPILILVSTVGRGLMSLNRTSYDRSPPRYSTPDLPSSIRIDAVQMLRGTFDALDEASTDEERAAAQAKASSLKVLLDMSDSEFDRLRELDRRARALTHEGYDDVSPIDRFQRQLGTTTESVGDASEVERMESMQLPEPPTAEEPLNEEDIREIQKLLKFPASAEP